MFKKKFLMILPISFIVGCATLGSSQNVDPVKQRSDIHFFVKIATRVALTELKPNRTDLDNIESYLRAAKQLVSENGPDLSGLRSLVNSQLPEDHKILAFTILDVIERYVLSVVPDPNEDQTNALKLIQAGLDGALGAVVEHVPR